MLSTQNRDQKTGKKDSLFHLIQYTYQWVMTFRDCEITLSVFFFLLPPFFGSGTRHLFWCGARRSGKTPRAEAPQVSVGKLNSFVFLDNTTLAVCRLYRPFMLANGHTNCSARGLSELVQTNTDGWPNLNSLELESGSLKLDTPMHWLVLCNGSIYIYIYIYVWMSCWLCMCDYVSQVDTSQGARICWPSFSEGNSIRNVWTCCRLLSPYYCSHCSAC